MTLSDVLKTLETPSNKAWRGLVAWLDARSADVGLVARLRRQLASWPLSLQRSPPARWFDEARLPLLSLCWAPGGLLVEVSGGGGGLPSHSIVELVSPDRLGEAVDDLLCEVFDETGDYDSSVYATPFRHGQVSGASVELTAHVVATYEPLNAKFRLNEMPGEVRALLRAHRERCFERSNADSPGPLVPLEIRWSPSELNWATTEGASNWHVFENLIIYDDETPQYRDMSPGAHAPPTREYWPPEPPGELGRAAHPAQLEDELDERDDHGEVSIEAMLGAKTVEALLRTLISLVSKFGLWTTSKDNLEAAFERALFLLTVLPDPARRATRITEALGEVGELRGPVIETVAGLLCIHDHMPEVLRGELKDLQARELLVMEDPERVDALVPLCAWALSSHSKLDGARRALAEAIIDHPLVDDLFCADDALLAHRGA